MASTAAASPEAKKARTMPAAPAPAGGDDVALAAGRCPGPLQQWLDTASAPDITQRFNALAKQISTLRAAGAPKESIATVVEELVAVKKAHRRKTWKPRKGKGKGKGTGTAGAPKPAWEAYPDPVAVPMCREDPDFVQAFAPGDPLALEFFATFGFVVFEKVLSAAECDATRGEVWEQLAANHPGFDPADEATWDLLSSKTYGLPPTQAIFTPQLLANRQNSNIVRAFRQLLGCEGVLVSQDRWCAYRPAKARPEWRTRGNLHLDVQPWGYVAGHTQVEDLAYDGLVDFITETNSVIRQSGPHVQGVLNLADNRDEDGGTHLVPGFHRRFDAWLGKLGGIEDNTAEGGDNNWVVRRRQGGGSFKFCPSDPIQTRARRVPMREGSLLVWNQEVVHGSVPNGSTAWRLAQFVKAFPSAPVGKERAQRRAAAVRAHIDRAGLLGSVTPLGRAVFGLDTAEGGQNP